METPGVYLIHWFSKFPYSEFFCWKSVTQIISSFRIHCQISDKIGKLSLIYDFRLLHRREWTFLLNFCWTLCAFSQNSLIRRFSNLPRKHKTEKVSSYLLFDTYLMGLILTVFQVIKPLRRAKFFNRYLSCRRKIAFDTSPVRWIANPSVWNWGVRNFWIIN